MEKESNIDRAVRDLLDGDLLTDWRLEINPTIDTSHLRPGVEKLIELITTAYNKAISGQQINLLIEGSPSVIHSIVYLQAAQEILPLIQETSEAALEHMKTLEDPLGVLIEIGNWVTSSLVQRIAVMNREGNHSAGIHTAHVIMSGIWSITGFLGHSYITWRDIHRDRCTVCTARPSEDTHQWLTDDGEDVSLTINGDGEHEKD